MTSPRQFWLQSRPVFIYKKLCYTQDSLNRYEDYTAPETHSIETTTLHPRLGLILNRDNKLPYISGTQGIDIKQGIKHQT